MSRVVHFHRKPPTGAYSIEALFGAIRGPLERLGSCVEVATAPYESSGLLNRLRIMAWAYKRAGNVNHITGDINFIALVLPGRKTIITVHDLTTLHRLRGLRRWLYKQLWFWLPLRRARTITAISQATKDDLCREIGLPQDSVMVIPNAVPQLFQPAPYAFNTACPRILQVGTRPNKNVLRLLKALEGIECHLHLVGHPDQETQDALEKSMLRHTVHRDLTPTEMYDVYCHADVVTLISTNEGFGMPIIEAQWVERPVITSNCSSMPEVAGESACLVDPFDIADIRRGIERVLQEPSYRNTLIENGRQNRMRFQVEEVAKQYAMLYRKLLA